MTTLFKQFLEDYESLGTRDQDGCLLWNYHCVDRKPHNEMRGYGKIYIHGRYVTVTRAVYHYIVDGTLSLNIDKDRTMVIDHLCRKTSCYEPKHLQLVTFSENIIRGKASALKENKTSKYPGVYWQKGTEKWRARARLAGRMVHLGYFDNEDEAYATIRKWEQNG